MKNLSLFERRLRISTGLVLATYVIVHLVDHSLGLVAFDVMETARESITRFWRHCTGSTLLYSSLVTHFTLGLVSLYRRSTLRMPPWEPFQPVLGLSMVPLLAGHVAATWGTCMFMQGTVDYEFVLSGILNDAWLSTRQLVLISVAWSHVVIGLHFFLRLFLGYRSSTKYMYPLAVLLPLLAILGVVRVGIELEVWEQKEANEYRQSGYKENYAGGYEYGGGRGGETRYSRDGT
jgi:adenylate cyclase